LKKRKLYLVVIALAVLISLLAVGCKKSYGTKLEFNGGELFYTSKVDKDEAQKLGEFLVEAGFYDGVLKSVQLTKSGGKYQFRMVVKKNVEKDESYIEIAKLFAEELSMYVFDNEKVEIHLCDKYFKTLRVVP